MSRFIYFFIITTICLISIINASAQESEKCITGDACCEEEKDMELSLGYYQFREGFIHADLTAAFDIALGIGFYEQGLKFGYNPWRESILIQTTQSIGLGFIAYEAYTGWVQDLNGNSSGFFWAPGINVSFKYFDLAYSYSFNFKKELSGFTPKSNLNIKIPITSTCGFKKFNEKKRWHWGEAHHGPYWIL